jgi:PEP-CTERM motif
LNPQSRIAASVALGVWEIVYETGLSDYSVTNGDFSTFGDFVDIQAQADSYLAAVLNGSLGDVDDLGALIAFDNQSQVFLLGGGIPEPTTWGMMILGFGMIGAVLRRRREQNIALA